MFALGIPPCVDKNGKLVVFTTRTTETKAIGGKWKCASELKCVTTKSWWDGEAFENSYGYCSRYNSFSSDAKLCESLNGSFSYQSDSCYTALTRGSVVDLGDYLLTKERNFTISLPNHQLLRLNTSGYDFIPKDETMYLEFDERRFSKLSQKPIDSRVPYLRMFKIPRVKVSLNLQYSQSNNSLLLHCYNCDYLGFYKQKKALGCYTRDDYGHKVELKISQFRNINSRLQVFNVQQLQNVDEGLRQYFCEGITIFDLENVTSEKVLVGYQEPSTLSLAFFMNSSTFLINRTDFIGQFKKNMSVRSARIIRVEPSKKILMHALVSNSTYTMKTFKESMMKRYGERFLGNVNSTDYCFGEAFYTSFWKTVKPGETSFIDDYKVRNKKGAPMSRKCVGNFEYGAIWEPIKEKPVIKEMDQKTQKWFGIVEEMNETNVNENVAGLTKDICRSAWKMEPASVVVMADVFHKFKVHRKTIGKESLRNLSEVSRRLVVVFRRMTKVRC